MNSKDSLITERQPSPAEDSGQTTGRDLGWQGEPAHGKHLSTERKVQGGFVFALALLCVIGVVSYLSIVRLREDAAWVRHTDEVIIRLELLFSTVTDAQNGHRGYAVTGDETYLEPYRLAVQIADAEVQQLRELMADNPVQQRQLDLLSPMVDEQLAFGGEVIALRRSQGFEAARSKMLTREGKRIHDQVRNLVNEMKGAEESLLKKRELRARQSTTIAQVVIIGGSVLAFGFVGLALFAIRRDFAGRRRAEEDLREAKKKLEVRVLDRTAELAQADESLRKNEAQLQTIVENLDEGVIASDLDGRLLQWNRAALKLHGYSDSDQDRRRFTELVDTFELSTLEGLTLPVEQWPLARILRGENLRDLEVRIRRIQTDWQRVFSYGGTLVHNAAGQPLLAVVTINDITERKRAEEEISQLNAELEQRVERRTAELGAANKELEAFSYSVSHDLRAPLRHVAGFVELLQKDAGPSLSEKSLRHLTIVSQSARRMGDLIDDLLTFSRVGRAEMRKTEVDLDRLVQDTLGDFEAGTKERNIVWKINPLPPVWADRALLRMALVNLISNALKFTGARLKAKIEIGCAPNGNGETVIFIRDNGAGFDPQYTAKLFGVFQRLHTHKEFEGTGIGLANVQRIVLRHGGRAWAEGVVDGGATFYFSIPKQNGGINGNGN